MFNQLIDVPSADLFLKYKHIEKNTFKNLNYPQKTKRHISKPFHSTKALKVLIKNENIALKANKYFLEAKT